MNKETKPIYVLSIRNPPQNEKYAQTKSKGMDGKRLHANGNFKKAGVAILK